MNIKACKYAIKMTFGGFWEITKELGSIVYTETIDALPIIFFFVGMGSLIGLFANWPFWTGIGLIVSGFLAALIYYYRDYQRNKRLFQDVGIVDRDPGDEHCDGC